MKAYWKNGTKIYAEFSDGAVALWYDPEMNRLHDLNEAVPVCDEAGADKLAEEWAEIMRDDGDIE